MVVTVDSLLSQLLGISGIALQVIGLKSPNPRLCLQVISGIALQAMHCERRTDRLFYTICMYICDGFFY